jgi:quinol monooxygenase YgiN
MMILALQNSIAQDKTTYMRIAKITVDSVKLNDYLIALKTQMQLALKYEKGVLAYSAIQDKNNPNKITILETYASVPAYQSHIQTEHFKKYKTTVADMVKELELTDVIPILIQIKQK